MRVSFRRAAKRDSAILGTYIPPFGIFIIFNYLKIILQSFSHYNHFSKPFRRFIFMVLSFQIIFKTLVCHFHHIKSLFLMPVNFYLKIALVFFSL